MSYQVILDNKYDISQTCKSMTLSDAVDDIAVKFKCSIVNISGLPKIDTIMPISLKYDNITLFDGIIWDLNCDLKGTKPIDVTAYDRIKYLAESEDEYLFSSGITADSIIKIIVNDWNIPCGSIDNTKVKLSKQLFRGGRNLYIMIQDSLKETVEKGGQMYLPTMRFGKLELKAIGCNENILTLQNLESGEKNKTMQGVVTKVKVLGNTDSDNKLSPVLAVVEKDTQKYGTVQKIYSSSKTENTAQAKKAGEKLLSSPVETYSYTGIDIVTVGVGDKVKFDNRELIITSIDHELGYPGHMSMEMTPLEVVKNKYYV